MIPKNQPRRSRVTVKDAHILKNIQAATNSRKMDTMRFFIQLLALIAIIAGTGYPAFCEDEELPMNCQVMVSLMELDEDSPDLDKETYDVTFYGAAAQKPFQKDVFEYGIETGANVCMENDTNVLSSSAGSSGGTIRVEIDNQLFLFDYFGGGYVAVNFAKRLRLYAGAGPLLIYGRWEHEPDENDGEIYDETESRLSAGLYGRAGIEVAIIEQMSIGGGIRAITTGLDFSSDNSAGEIKVEGPQVFFNLSFKI